MALALLVTARVAVGGNSTATTRRSCHAIVPPPLAGGRISSASWYDCDDEHDAGCCSPLKSPQPGQRCWDIVDTRPPVYCCSPRSIRVTATAVVAQDAAEAAAGCSGGVRGIGWTDATTALSYYSMDPTSSLLQQQDIWSVLKTDDADN